MKKAYKLVAIHQPNLFPWLGYFNKILRSDLFIVMDIAQFSKKKGNWATHVKIFISGEPRWLTVPVERNYHGVLDYREIKIFSRKTWRKKMLRTIEINYKKTPYFEEIYPFFEQLIQYPAEYLIDFNMNAIYSILSSLKIDVEKKIILGSQLDVSGKGTDLLVDMVRASGGSAYLAGGGCQGYQEDEKFPAAGLQLIFQNFTHPVYSQFNTHQFIPGLSIIDALMNCGFQGTAQLLMEEAMPVKRSSESRKDISPKRR